VDLRFCRFHGFDEHASCTRQRPVASPESILTEAHGSELLGRRAESLQRVVALPRQALHLAVQFFGRQVFVFVLQEEEWSEISEVPVYGTTYSH
jgi:hypothetical protein